MKRNVSEYDFQRAFEDMGRSDQFSYKGLKALYEYLERFEEDTGQEMELDVIALCCEFTEYKNLEELQENYTDIEDMEDLEQHTMVIMIDEESFIIQDF